MYIPPQRRKQADVLRLTTTYDSNGNLVAQDYNVVYGTHTIDFVPNEMGDEVVNNQQKFTATHEVFPQLVHVMPFTKLNDFYRVNQKLYRIIKRWDFVERVYFEVRDDAPEEVTTLGVTLQNKFIVYDLGPGVYTYGSGALVGIGPFATRPLLLDTLMSDSGHWIANPSVSGFEIVSKYEGVTPVVTVQIEGVLA